MRKVIIIVVALKKSLPIHTFFKKVSLQIFFKNSPKFEMSDRGWGQKTGLHLIMFITPSKIAIYLRSKNYTVATAVAYDYNWIFT